jgi:hypothetical protein
MEINAKQPSYLSRLAVLRSWKAHYCKNTIIFECICRLSAISIKIFPVIFDGN